MFRIILILGVFVVLACTSVGTAANDQTGRPDGRLTPDSADIPRTGAPPESAVTTGRPDGRLAPDSVDARNTVTPVVIYKSGTASFDWFAALIGGLTVGGLTLAVGGLFVFRHHGPAPVA